MDTEAFKKEVKPHLEAAIEANGGIERVRRIYGMMGGVADFIAGWTASQVVAARELHRSQAARRAAFDGYTVPYEEQRLTHEEIRRIYDLTRLRITSESSTC